MHGVHGSLPAEVAPAAPAIGFGLATLATFLAWAICLGLAVAWRHTIGWGMRWVAQHIRGVGVNVLVTTIHPFDFLADVLDTINENIANALATAALNSEHAAIWCFHETERTAVLAAKLIYDATLDTYRWAVHFENVTMPHFVHRIERHLTNLIHAARIDAHKAEVKAEHYADAQVKHAEKLARREIHHAEAVVGADVLPRIKTVERDFGRLADKLDALAKRLAPATIVALIGATIWKELFNGVKCQSWKDLNRNHGCAPWKLLKDVLDLLAVVGLGLLGVLKPVVLAEAAVSAVDTIEPLLADILDN